ncbi:MAG: hypothetical protein QXS24_03190 [Desulfurococcaceae archaeon]
MVRCPFCGFEANANNFKLLREPWRHGFYEVRMLECPKCKSRFNYYEGVLPKGKHSSFKIKLRTRGEAEAGREGEERVDHDTIVQLLVELEEMLGFHVRCSVKQHVNVQIHKIQGRLLCRSTGQAHRYLRREVQAGGC